MSESKNYSTDELLTMLEELQNQNEAQRKQLKNYEQLLSKAGAELSAERKAQETIQEKQLNTIREQERTLDELSESNNSLRRENEKLLKLAEQQRQLQSENEKLKKGLLLYKKSLEDQTSELDAVKKTAEAAADKYHQLLKAMPKKEDIQSFSKVLDDAQEAAFKTHVLNYVNTAVVVVFVALTAFTGWHVYNTRQDVVKASKSVQSVRDAIYNSEGWSVFNGAVTSEEVWSKKHPQEYQQYLKDKENSIEQQ